MKKLENVGKYPLKTVGAAYRKIRWFFKSKEITDTHITVLKILFILQVVTGAILIFLELITLKP